MAICDVSLRKILVSSETPRCPQNCLSFSQKNPRVRKIRVRNSGPETAAPILWTPRISAFFLQENLHVHKIPRFGGGGEILGLGGGGSADFIFMGAGIFLILSSLFNCERVSVLLTLQKPRKELK